MKNAYYVEISENGKIYEVENEAGIGFTNMAQTGSLRIEKTSSDGKVEGFSFRVTGANGYEQIFTTDENGEIFIEGLRVGDTPCPRCRMGPAPTMCCLRIRR